MRFAVIDCEDAPKWSGHERLWIDNLERPGDEPWRVYRAFAGELPDQPFDGVVITGSHYSVLDDSLPWLPGLFEYIQRTVAGGGRIAGACFGCQAIARACGGAVERHPGARFDIGAFEVAVEPITAPWATPLGRRTRLRLLASHEDSVTTVPPGATAFGRTAHNPFELFVIGDRALAIQPHPELTPALIEAKILPSLVDKGRIAAADLPRIVADMAAGLDSSLVMAAIRAFIAGR